jgi:hypothetical protein
MRGPLYFEHIGMCFYKLEKVRPPKKGEYYLSGAIVTGYQAPNDLSSSYQVAVPTHKAVQRNEWVAGHAI